MTAIIYSRALCGVEAPLVTVEVHISNGLPALSIVGLPEAEVRESKDRVRSALLNAQFDFPARRITINLAPADLPKGGARFDLPIALGILAASGQIPGDKLTEYEFIGELALTGEVRPVKGALSTAFGCVQHQHILIVPKDNASEAGLVKDLNLFAASHLLEVTGHLASTSNLAPCQSTGNVQQVISEDMRDVRGQHQARRALEIAATGRHSLLLMGPPGTGKTMLASRLPGILPSMSESEAVQTAAIQSVSLQGFHISQWRQRPFRNPHHTASAVALVGGGSQPRPGEISLAHNGVLFLDEFPEFDRRVLEVLREPLETGCIHISRAARQVTFPARFQLMAAMNPCPCGYLGDADGRCHCSEDQIRRYRGRISGPLLDRIDMHIEVPRLDTRRLQSGPEGESSTSIRQRVEEASQRQLARSGGYNHDLTHQQVSRFCQLDNDSQALLQQATDSLGLSARAYHHILKVARTIADMDHQAEINSNHLSEALGYRRLDRTRQTY